MTTRSTAYHEIRELFREYRYLRPQYIHKLLGVSRSTIHRQLKRLLHRGFITKIENGPNTLYYPLRIVPAQEYPEIDYTECNMRKTLKIPS